MRYFFIIIVMNILFSLCNANEWRIRLGVENSDRSYIDPYNDFGVSFDANDGYGFEDFINIFSPETHYIDLYFPHDDTDRVGYWEPPHDGKYSIDIRNDSTIVHNFYFDVFCNSTHTENVAVYWVEQDSVPPSYRIEISPLHEESVNIFVQDTIWKVLLPGVHYFLAYTKKGAYEKITISPNPIFLRIGEYIFPSVYLMGDEDTLRLENPQWNIDGEAATLDDGILTGIEEGTSHIIACFRGWCDTVSVFVAGTGVPIQIHLEPGWNLVSIPVMPATTDAEAIFGDIGENIFGFDGETQAYQRIENISQGEGFFIFSMFDTVFSIAGEPVLGISAELSPGWHIIGCPMLYVPTSSITSYPARSFLPEIYGFDGTNYFRTDTLSPGRGYWLFQIFDSEVNIHP